MNSVNPMLIRSVTAVSILMLRWVLFTLGRGITIQVRVDLLAVTLSLAEDLIRLVLISIPIVEIIR